LTCSHGGLTSDQARLTSESGFSAMNENGGARRGAQGAAIGQFLEFNAPESTPPRPLLIYVNAAFYRPRPFAPGKAA
jgi:hypothetical protein